MHLIETFQLEKNWGGDPVFNDLSFSINPGEKIGLIGRNGSGKTTLLEIIAGRDEDFSGTLRAETRSRIGYVPQYLRMDSEETVKDFLLGDIIRLRGQLARLEEDMGGAEGEELEAVLNEYQQTRELYDGLSGDTAETRMKRFLDGSGLTGKESITLAQLSGGERNILSLLRVMISLPDLLILDEPGNHLDYAGLTWLETFLRQQRCAVLLVSHNRYLLDRVVDRIWELGQGEINEYTGNYSAYRLEKLRNIGAAGKQYKAEQKKIARLEELVRRFEEAARNTADPAWGRRLRARRTQLEKVKEQAVNKPEVSDGNLDIAFSELKSRADIALAVSGYFRGFGDIELLENADLFIGTGERVALTGPNGCGKSTFLRDLVEEGHWDNPIVRIGPSMVIGYCAQHQEVFDPNLSILAEFEKITPGTRDDVFRFLSRFYFTWEDLERTIGTLSGGEKNRLQIARAIYLKANFLVLDEPTNHLDISSREAIENGLEDFKGTLLVVSHDRYFLDKIADRVVEISDRRFVDYQGNFSEYWAVRSALKRRGGAEIQKRSADLRKKSRTAGDRGTQKELEEKIMRLEAEQRTLERNIEEAYRKGDYDEGGRLSGELEKLTALIAKSYDRWSKL